MSVLTAISNRDARTLRELLADRVTFHSPVRTYRDREQIVNLLVTIGDLLGELTVERELHGPGETVSFIRALAGDDELDGVLDQRFDASGRTAELTLMLRPLGELLRAVRTAGQLLDAQGRRPVQRREPAAAASSNASPPTAKA